MTGNGKHALADALDICAAELTMLIDRHFAVNRALIVSNDEGKNWTAAINDDVLYRSPNGPSVLRFARTFADRTPGVIVVVADDPGPDERWSVRADRVVVVEHVVKDNVVPITGGAA